MANAQKNDNTVTVPADQWEAMQAAIANLQKDRETAEAKDELISQLVAKIEDLNAQVNPPDEAEPAPLPVYNDKPVDAAHKRIRVKSVRGKATTPKVRLVDDTVDQEADTYRCHGFLHEREVVDVPNDLFRELKPLIKADLLEETSEPATRPLFYPSEAECRFADPRNRRTEKQTAADIERVKQAQATQIEARKKQAAEAAKTS